MSFRDFVQTRVGIIVSWLMISGLIFSVIMHIKYGTIEPANSPEVSAFTTKAATISLVLPLAVYILGVVIVLIIYEVILRRDKKLTQELELLTMERKRIVDKKNGILRKLKD